MIRYAMRARFDIDDAIESEISPSATCWPVVPRARLFEELSKDLGHTETR